MQAIRRPNVGARFVVSVDCGHVSSLFSMCWFRASLSPEDRGYHNDLHGDGEVAPDRDNLRDHHAGQPRAHMRHAHIHNLLGHNYQDSRYSQE